jgi:class 3 adenylate cyclase
MSAVRPILLCSVWVLAVVPVLLADVNRETGTYSLQNYLPKEYGASPENWSIVQDHRGVMYFGNTAGVLESDGISWRTIPLANGSFARSLAIDDRGAVYVGGVGDFGFLQADARGTTQFISLLSRVPRQDREFTDVWRILPTRRGMYFSSNRRLFRLNTDGTIRVWLPATRFGKAFSLGDAVFVKTPERGLLRMDADEFRPVPGGERLAGTAVAAAVQTAKGTLIATADRLYRLTSSGIEPYPTQADSYFAKSLIYTTLALPNGEIAIGTRKGGLVLLSPEGSVERIIDKSDGLLDDYITAMQIDRQGSVWLSQANGITRLNLGLSHYGNAEDLRGEVQSITRHRGAIYAGTSVGLFRMESQPGKKPHFDRIGDIDNTVWSILPYEGNLLVATASGVSLVSGKESKQILADSGRQDFWDLSVSPSDPGKVYAAGKAGVFVLRKVDDHWQEMAELPAQGQEFRSVLEDDDGKVWATTQQAVWRIDFRQQPPVAEKFDISKGVPVGWKNVRRLNGHILFATEKGLKRYSEITKRFVPDASLGTEFADGSRDVYNIFEERAGNVWVTGKNYHGVLIRQANGYKWQPAPLLLSGIREIFWMHLDDDGTCWAFGDDSVLVRWERAVSGNPDQDFHVLTRRVEVLGSKDPLYGGAGAFPSLRLPYSSKAMRFEFTAPFFEDPSAVEYQVNMEGSDNDWSPWSHEARSDYTNLSEGAYTFRVRARSPHGTVSEQATFPFAVLPPWYRTWWAYSTYFIFGAFGIWGIVRFRTRQLKEEKKQLEVIVEERTVEIRQQRDEIQVQERKSHSLLLNILPATVADELKSTGSVQPVGFDDVTVCFTDFVGFTLSSEKMAPGTLVNALNEYFTAFDEIVSRYGLEKLKTIGDSYMFASGLPAPRDSHAVDAVLAAMEMADVVKKLATKTGGTGWNVRIGLHSGPVVAGVVGIKKFAFDIWGNTVNFAARMESSGVPGHVNMSERTCYLLRGLIETRARGNVKIKEGRELPMFLALGPATTDEPAFANSYRQAFGLEMKSFPTYYCTPAPSVEKMPGVVSAAFGD